MEEIGVKVMIKVDGENRCCKYCPGLNISKGKCRIFRALLQLEGGSSSTFYRCTACADALVVG